MCFLLVFGFYFGKRWEKATILRELYVELIFFVSKYEIAVVQQAGKLNSLQSEILHQLWRIYRLHTILDTIYLVMKSF